MLERIQSSLSHNYFKWIGIRNDLTSYENNKLARKLKNTKISVHINIRNREEINFVKLFYCTSVNLENFFAVAETLEQNNIELFRSNV